VTISPSDGNTATTDETQQGSVDVTPVPEQPKHWIGLLGGPVTPELRAHLEIPADQGLLVRQVLPESPAAKAGLETYDILLRANETDLHDMRDLMELVRTSGEQQAQITLEVVRHGKRETVYITPEARPEKITGVQADATTRRGDGPGFGDYSGENVPEDVLKFFEQRGGREGGPFAFRMFGPGTVLRQHPAGVGGIPSGVSVSIQKQDDQPAHITVKRGDQTWEVVGDDPGSLQQLPDDVRPFVEQLLHGGGMQMPIPDMQQFNSPAPPGAPGVFNDRELRDRLEAMERHLQQLEERLQGSADEAPAATE
jgi:membrane-associated protease RseP (regulator of RpoE activity)